MYVYRPVEEWGFHEDIGRFRTFGIAVYRNSRLLFLRSDVFAGRAVVEEICRLCTAEQVEPVHLEDVIEDSL